MAINVEYGPISTALGLAQKAGKGQRNRVVAQQDLQFLNLIQDAQAQADHNYANQVQIALGHQDEQDRLGLAADNAAANRAQQDRQFALAQQGQNASIADQNADRQYRYDQLASSQQQTQAKTQAAEAHKAQAEAYLNSLPDSPEKQQAIAYYQGSGKLPETVIPQNPSHGGQYQQAAELNTLHRRYTELASALAASEKALAAQQYDPKNREQRRAGRSGDTWAGNEAKYAAALAIRDQATKALGDINGQLDQRTNAMLGGQQVQAPAVQQLIQARSAVPAGGPAAAQQGTVTINSMQEYAQLPSGTAYVDAQTGLRAVKP